MGKLVPFQKRSGVSKTPLPPRGKAEILIFTGVRYERDGSSDAPAKPTASPRNKRKRG